MNRRDIVVGVLVLAVLAGAIYFWQRPQEQEELPVPETLSVEDEIEDMFNLEVPESAERAELSDQTDGDSSGLATRDTEGEQTEITVLADLPESDAGMTYTARVSNDEDELTLGSLRQAKGGYLLNYSSQQDLSQYSTVQVLSGDEVVLEGSF